jgi:hypothetical protein
MEIEMVPIPGTEHMIRREYFFRGRDPETRELQYRFLERYPEKVRRERDKRKGFHATSSAQARLKLELMSELIEELKSERSDASAVKEKQKAVALVDRGIKALHDLAEFRSGSAL